MRVEKHRYVRYLLVMIILTVQVLQIFHYTFVKQNFFIDELLSMGYSHFFIHEIPSGKYIMYSEDWEYETWISNRELKEQLETVPEDSLLNLSFPKAVKMLLTRRNYHGILNIIMSVFSPGEVTKEPGIFLNIPFFVCIQLLLYRMCMRFSGNLTCSLLTLIMYGFSPAAVNMTGFIRFYCLSVLLFMAAVYLHEEIWRSHEPAGIVIRTVAALFLLYLAMKNSELILVLGGTLIAAFGFVLFLRRRYKEGICYLLSSLPGGLFFACTRTSLIKIILHPSKYVGSGWPVGHMTQALLGMSLSERLQQLKYAGMLLEWQFGSRWIAAVFAVIVIVLAGSFLFRFTGRDRISNVSVPEAGTLQRAEKEAVPEAETGAGNPQELSPDELLHMRWTFYLVLFAVTAVYLLFYWLVGFMPNRESLRYLYFIYPLITFFLWMGLDAMTKSCSYRKHILSFCIVLTIAGIVCGRMDQSQYQYLYPEDKAVIQEIRKSGIQKAVILFDEENNPLAHSHCVYDCVNIMADDAWIYPMSEKHPHIDTASCPEKMYVFGFRHDDLSGWIEDLTERGFVLQKFGETHASSIYVAEKKQSTGNNITIEQHSDASKP